ncbi:MAG: gluconolaconase [Methylacidiphilales bacterium]|nr:gluconolaconase [Candidatus Methylacidiphilales bacterium]NJR17539.1 gluconolaconase [Calothrix sp. CSU_2_0]
MKRRDVLFGLGFLGTIARTSLNSALVSAEQPNSIPLPTEFQYPNGITRSRNGILYVGSITSGLILRISPNGRITTFFPGNRDIFAANSLRLDEKRNILWGASSDFLGTRNSRGEIIRRPHRIFAINIRSGKVLRVILMPDNGFGNDIAIAPDGGVYVTDSNQPRIHYLASGRDILQTWVTDERFRAKGIGLAGITRRADGVSVVGNYTNGELFKVTPQTAGKPKVELIPLERKLDNPDGIQFAPDGTLIFVEGAVETGNGRLLRIDISAKGSQPQAIQVLAENLVSPVNLTIAGREIWVTESQIRHRILPGKEKAIPDRFFVRRFRLS